MSDTGSVGSYIHVKLEKVFSWLGLHYRLFTATCFVLMTALMFLLTPFDAILRADAYDYLSKALEIVEGDWTPGHHRLMGWPIAIAAFLKLFGIESVFGGMVVAKALSITFMGLSIFPFAGIARRLLETPAAIVAVLAFSFFPAFILLGKVAYSEPLFIFLLLSGVYFLTAHPIQAKHLLWATVLASLAYYVRPNGVFLLLGIMLYMIFLARQREIRWLHLIWVPIVFIAVSLPHLYLRYEAYGSAFDYGENSKYFVDSYDEVWNPLVPAPSLFEYLSTHTFSDYFDKFVVNGVLKVGYNFFDVLGPLWTVLFMFGVLKYILWAPTRNITLLMILLVVMLIGLIPVYHIFQSDRYFLSVLPFVLIIGSRYLFELLQKDRNSNILAAFFALFLVAQPVIALEKGELALPPSGFSWSMPTVHDEWAWWAARNLSGTVAMMKGGDLIEMSRRALAEKQPSTEGEIAKHPAEFAYVRPLNYKNLARAMPDFKKLGITYLLLDREYIDQRPYLKEVYNQKWEKHFQLVKRFRSTPKAQWAIRDIDIFKVTY